MNSVASERPESAVGKAPEETESTGEEARQQAVDRSGILNRRAEAGLQRIVEAAARMYQAEIALLSIIDRSREWFAAQVGLDIEQVPRAQSFCLHAIRKPGEPLVILDALTDRRFAANPFVTDDPHIRFYAGVPLLDRAGYPLGALCVLDSRPRASMPSLFQLIRLTREAEQIIAR
jgi:GAF domain-containing protein